MQKADLRPLEGDDPDYVAVDETVIQLNNERFWLYGAVDFDTDRLLHVNLVPTRNHAITNMFPSDFREKHLIDDVLYRRFCVQITGDTPLTRPPIPRES